MTITTMTRHLPLLLLAALGAPAFAANNSHNDGYSNVYHRCMDAAAGATSAMLECIDKETRVQNVRLDRAYRVAQLNLDTKLQKPLHDIQQLWLKYRDANCGLYGRLTGGSIDRINGASCVLEMTKERTENLNGLAEFGG